MTQAVTVRRDGDTFQARLFWFRAARLLDAESPVVKVGFELGPRSFDDIWVEYDPRRSPFDQNGGPLLREHIQCKWHVTPDSYGYGQLIDPEFINANAKSLLQRAHVAQCAYAPAGIGIRFKLLTNWRIDRADPLREVIGTRSGALRLERLFGTATDNSKTGAIRKAWREHLGLDENALRLLAGTLAFGEATDSLDDLRETLDLLFSCVGLRRIPVHQSAFPYDDLVFQWMGQGRLEFDRSSFRAACDREGLLGEAKPFVAAHGVKSFEHPIDRLEDRCVQVLDFTPEFDERHIRNDEDWADKLYPALSAFLLAAAAKSDRLRLALDAHVTLAFAAGSVLNIKSGRAVELEQRTTDRRIWSPDDADANDAWPTLEMQLFEVEPHKPDLAVAVGLTHEIAEAVETYTKDALSEVGRILVCRPRGGPGARSVTCGRHAFMLAEAAAAEIRRARGNGPHLIHLFVAAPNAFTFFLGQRQPAMGVVRLYEFDFEGQRSGSYRPSISLPSVRHAADVA